MCIRDSGSDVVDEFNQVGGSSEGVKYPDLIKFPLVDDALNDANGYVPLHVYCLLYTSRCV